METNYESNTYTDSFEHIGNCPSDNKQIKQKITIDDGTGKLYEYELSKGLEWKEYTIEPNFSVNPDEPTILDETEIIPSIMDIFDVVEENGVDYDYSEDGESLNHQEDETVNQVLSVPRLQTVVQTVRYFTGWEIKTSQISKDIIKTNIPPEACNTQDLSCFTVPTAVYTSCSTDQEDSAQNLTIDWELYLDKNSTVEISEDEQGDEVRTVVYDDNNQDWDLQTMKSNNPVFSWTYNNEGRYKLVEIATDTDSDSSSAVREFDIVFRKCTDELAQSDQTVQASGVTEFEANVWQLVAVPMTTGYWSKNKHKIIKDSSVKSTVKNVIIDQIEDVYGEPAKNYIKVFNAYFGDRNQFSNYIPGFTKDTSVNNFRLVYTDDDEDVQDGITKFEVTGFWVKTLDRSFTIKWGIIK
jgi:hypothetical protein